MPLDDDEKADLRRHLEYSFIGLAQSGPQGQNFAYGDAGFRFFKVQGVLEQHMRQWSPIEESKICGRAFAAITFLGQTPQVGDTVTVTLSGGPFPAPIVHSITAPQLELQSQKWTVLTMAASLAQVFALDPAFQATGVQALAPYGSIPWAQTSIPSPTVAFWAPHGAPTFQMSATWSGFSPPQISLSPRFLYPAIDVATGCNEAYACQPVGGVVNYTNGQNGKISGFLPICNYLESQWLSASSRLVAISANGVELNPRELEQREKLYLDWCCKLALAIGLPKNPDTRERDQSGWAVC